MSRGSSADMVVVGFDTATAPSRLGHQLQSEALRIERYIGKNPYSDFLVKHACRPSPSQADTIGRLVGIRVKASDGKKYPRLTEDDRRQQQALLESIALSWRIQIAIADLADNNIDPAILVSEIRNSDDHDIGQRLEKAVHWLKRFADEWNNTNGQRATRQTSDQDSRDL